jgi:hypothetical protein
VKQYDDLAVSWAFVDVMHAEVITAIGVGDVGSSKYLHE